MAFVIVREGCAFPPLQRKTRLGPVERLDLAFLVDGDHRRVLGRVHVETDHIVKLGGEVGIVGSLEGPDPVRLEKLMGGPYALDRSQRKTNRLGHGAAGPMGDCTGRFAQGALDHGMHLGLRHWRDAGRAGLIAPSMPSSAKRCCQRHTIGRLTPTRLAIASTGRRSADSRMICAR